MTVLASKSAVKLLCVKKHLVTIAKAPDWTVYTYSEESKRICALPLAHYVNGFRMAMAITGEPPFFSNDFAKIRNDKLNGTTVEWYQSSKAFADKSYLSYTKEEVVGSCPMIVQYALANSLGLPNQVGLVMERFYGCPKENGVPLLMKYETCDHSQINKLSTQDISAQEFSASEFEIPKSGYTKVSTIIEVVANRANSANADEMLKTFSGFDR